jgi:hypothetical protein
MGSIPAGSAWGGHSPPNAIDRKTRSIFAGYRILNKKNLTRGIVEPRKRFP